MLVYAEKKQKSYNYEQKDFLSAPNLFDLGTMKIIVGDSTQGRRFYDATKKEKYEMNLLSPNEKNAAGTKGKRTQLEKQKMVAEMNSQEMEKSSLELIREKIMDYDLMVAEKQAR